MAELVTDDGAWRAAADEELRQLLDDLLHTEKTHLTAAERLQKVHRRLGLVATVLAVLAGATVLTERSTVGAGLLALASALASGVLTFLQPDRMAEQHLAAGRQLSALRVGARQAIALDVPRVPIDELRELVRRTAEDKAAVDASAPGTGSTDYAVARLKISSGVFDRDR